jgi:DNA topoisomerase IB
LGNTPAVCRRSYIDPRVFERFREGRTVSQPVLARGRMTARARNRIEREVRALIF